MSVPLFQALVQVPLLIHHFHQRKGDLDDYHRFCLWIPSVFWALSIYSLASMITSIFRRLRNKTNVLASIGGSF